MSDSSWKYAFEVFQVLGTAFIGYLIIKVREVKQIVDGPLSVSLSQNADLAKSNAALLRRIAEITHDPSDMIAADEALQTAAKAQILDENRKQGKSV